MQAIGRRFDPDILHHEKSMMERTIAALTAAQIPTVQFKRMRGPVALLDGQAVECRTIRRSGQLLEQLKTIAASEAEGHDRTTIYLYQVNAIMIRFGVTH